MQLSVDGQPDALDVLSGAIGGESLAGSGFEGQEPEMEYSALAPHREE